MVRLKGYVELKKRGSMYISIPYGSIKSTPPIRAVNSTR